MCECRLRSDRREPAAGLGETRRDPGAAEVDGELDRRGVCERDGGERGSEPARDERELDRAETLGAALQGPELDEARPELGLLGARYKLVDRLGQPALLVGQLEVDVSRREVGGCGWR